jgi:hypothetical protein
MIQRERKNKSSKNESSQLAHTKVHKKGFENSLCICSYQHIKNLFTFLAHACMARVNEYNSEMKVPTRQNSVYSQ